MDPRDRKLEKLNSLISEAEDLAQELGVDPADLEIEEGDPEEDE